MENVSYTIASLFREVLDRVESEGVQSDEEVHDVIESVLEDRIDTGEMSDQDNVERLREELRLKWYQHAHGQGDDNDT